MCSYKNNTLKISHSKSYVLSSYLALKSVNFLKSRLILNTFNFLWMFVNKLFTNLTCEYYCTFRKVFSWQQNILSVLRVKNYTKFAISIKTSFDSADMDGSFIDMSSSNFPVPIFRETTTVLISLYKVMQDYKFIIVRREITPRHGCSLVNLLHIFRTPFPKSTSGWLLLEINQKE